MNGRLFLGILLLLLGIGLILDVRDIWDFGDAWSTYWPLLLVVASVTHLSQQPRAAWG